MKKYLAGRFVFSKEINCSYYTDDFENFFYEDDKEVSEEDLKEWAVTLNSPWTDDCVCYQITRYTPKSESEPLLWKCEYSVVGYDGITATVIGYGYTESFALGGCLKLFSHLQEKYNPEDDSF